jgi:AcrR family transcriptional regulator
VSRRISAETRDALLGALETFVLEHGFARVTAEELAGRLGCSKSTLYGLAGRKEQIVLAALRGYLARMLAAADRASGQQSTVDGRLRTYLDVVGRGRGAMSDACVEDMLSCAATRDLYESTMDTISRRIGEIVGAGVGAGAFRAVSPSFVGAVATLVLDRAAGPSFLLDSLALDTVVLDPVTA